MSTEVATATAPSLPTTVPAQGMRKNGKQWHEPKSAFRPKAGNGTYEKRQEERKFMAAVKAKEKEMKEEKETERQRRITALKEKRAVKEEKARYEKLAETMHKKRVERLKRKEKRNKMLKS
ncbi:rRNA-processing protein [Lachnellula hyalina]|uniref:rRNA-processing protein n=1 Tax=Lachnellula hyalina TaxID=1316788 RepID=A0A8H8TXR4_9HELO|nr:rRNA-processing protein [Lachnellula hyalina]TVY24595.1 rRNA-processing protein [Lachnellula hyalina]